MDPGFSVLAWTYDPVCLVPIMAVAGASNEVHVWRLGWNDKLGSPAAEKLKTLRGHTGVRSLLPTTSFGRVQSRH